MATDRSTILTAYAALEQLHAAVAGFDYTGLTVPELLELQSRREVLARTAPAVDHALLTALQAQTTAKEIGAKNWAEVLAIRLRISSQEARRRVRDAEHLGPRTSLTGEALPPLWESVATAQADGTINTEHIDAIANFMTKLPSWVDDATRTQCEATLSTGARYQTPDELRQAADRLRYLLDQDGPAPDDTERARRRGITIGTQHPDGTCDINGRLTPEARAIVDAVFEKLAAPGMANPADPSPCVSGTPSAEQITSDTRTAAQRHHDAFVAAMRMVLASGALGEHNGLPVSVVVTTTLHELHTGAGLALTHTGSTLPIPDLIKMASNAYCYLAVFDHHTNIPLYLGRTRRTASPGQRIMLFARDRGCTRP
ncbi:MAG: 13E12 repeat family protein, partial [Mycobacterium sp.]